MNVLLTSVGRRSYLVEYFKKELKGKGEVHVANSTSMTPAFEVADRGLVTPLIHSKDYIPTLLDYCKKNNIEMCIPLFDIDLPVLSKHKKKFEAIGTTVVVSDSIVIDICNDKMRTNDFLINMNTKSPQTFNTLDETIDAIKSKKVSFPLIIKPRWGMGSIGVLEAENIDELHVLYQKTFREIENSYLIYESEQSLNKSVIIQEKLKGQEFGLDIINDLEGNYINTIVKLKHAMRSGETDCAETVANAELASLGNRISSKLKHIGNLDVDVFVNDSKVYVLEMNARFGGGYPFSHVAGVNLPKALIKWLNKESASKDLFDYETNVLCHKDINLVQIENRRMIESNQSCFKYLELSDYASIIAVLKSLSNEITPSINEKVGSLSDYAEKLLKNSFVISAMCKDSYAGFISFYSNDNLSKQAYISFIVVNEQFRKKGVGRNLLRKAIRKAIMLKMKSVKLEVRKSNKSAITFYKRNGFELCGEASDNSYHMIKDLGE